MKRTLKTAALFVVFGIPSIPIVIVGLLARQVCRAFMVGWEGLDEIGDALYDWRNK